MQPHTVRHDPRQLVTDLARSNSTNDGQAVKLDRALSPVPQLNVDVGKQVVTSVHHHTRCREFAHNRHEPMVEQLLHYVKPSVTVAFFALSPGHSFGDNPVVDQINTLIEQRCALTIRRRTDPASDLVASITAPN